jgi:hypothetical protein
MIFLRRLLIGIHLPLPRRAEGGQALPGPRGLANVFSGDATGELFLHFPWGVDVAGAFKFARCAGPGGGVAKASFLVGSAGRFGRIDPYTASAVLTFESFYDLH